MAKLLSKMVVDFLLKSCNFYTSLLFSRVRFRQLSDKIAHIWCFHTFCHCHTVYTILLYVSRFGKIRFSVEIVHICRILFTLSFRGWCKWALINSAHLGNILEFISYPYKGPHGKLLSIREIHHFRKVCDVYPHRHDFKYLFVKNYKLVLTTKWVL
jgi:hypothetical protein